MYTPHRSLPQNIFTQNQKITKSTKHKQRKSQISNMKMFALERVEV